MKTITAKKHGGGRKPLNGTGTTCRMGIRFDQRSWDMALDLARTDQITVSEMIRRLIAQSWVSTRTPDASRGVPASTTKEGAK